MARKQKKNKVDYFARAVSILSLIISLLAVVVPVWQDSSRQKEDLNIDVHIDEEGQVLFEKNEYKIRSLLLPYKVVVSNTGNINCSIKRFEAKRRGEILNFPPLKYSIYPKTDLPLSLEAGKTSILNIKIEYVPQKQVLKVLNSRYINKRELKLGDLRVFLARKGTSIFNQNVSLINVENVEAFVSYSPKQIRPNYIIKMVTGREKVFQTASNFKGYF